MKKMILMSCQTKSHLEKNKTMKSRLTWMLVLCLIGVKMMAVDVPDRPNPPRLVNDLAGMFSPEEIQSLESNLEDFSNRTSTQIVVLTVKSLNGEDKSIFATEVGQKWGVGQKGFDNGVVILLKEKTIDSKGEVFIATGYGLEGALPDATCKLIVENEMIPSFKQNNYVEGIEKAVATIMQISLGEFSAKEYNSKHAAKNENPAGAIIALFVVLFVILNIFRGSNSVRNRHIGKNLPFWILLGMLGSGSRSSSGSWGNFNSGGGSFGGGGFGGFGGGGFGGGGAGGSW